MKTGGDLSACAIARTETRQRRARIAFVGLMVYDLNQHTHVSLSAKARLGNGGGERKIIFALSCD